ncbi:GEVED domain-containing protein [Hymenobacter sediminicola]|uniref:PKD domain-containing protein n=1 Tax=Hymenobacter sediminicola TaxID=2761579 RepID=A0A7G7WB97_9BACT|nr:GEVED domain-containing protein [Hymenobacter sediminicola]QNH63640.1 PKD domain-containing protein [Hymenobacter sediminicola]
MIPTLLIRRSAPAFWASLLLLILPLTQTAWAQCPPTTSACTPGSAPSSSFAFGMGILNVTLGSINNTTLGVQEGFRDYACTIGTTLTVGQNYPISVRTNANANENVRVYLDLNNDGTLNPTTELIFSSNSAKTHSGTISLPTGTVLNTALRLRVAADYVNVPLPTPCSTPQYSQTEDYAVTVQANVAPPVTEFSADATLTCSGCVQFTDQTQNAPTGWLWNFGDNTTSTLQNPRHCYTTPGTYTVTLTATNAAGNNVRTRTNYIVYNNAVPVAATCTPATTAFCCGYGITQFTLGSLTKTSQNGQAGYEDFTCGSRVQLTEGNTYAVSVTTGTNPQDTRIWLDLNNDGTFTSNELLFTALNRTNPTGSFLLPGSALKNVPLRLRVLSDYVGGADAPCAAPQLGQIEDYTVTVLPNTNPPVSAFASNYVLGACQNPVQFTDQSQNAPTSWFWEFGDGATSTLQNPSHQYTAGGAFSVTLTTTNAFGNNSITKTNSVVLMQPCVRYCEATGTTPNIWLTNVAVRRNATQDFANASAASPAGYGNYVDKVINLYQGANTSLDMTVNANFQHVLWAWVDWNRNGTFETTEQISNGITTASTFTAGFTVPSTVATRGFTRMRVMVRLNNLPTPSACQVNQNNSETEDYSVLVSPTQSTAEARSMPALSIFPNPTTDGKLHLRLPDPSAAGTYAVTVQNVLGATLLTSTVRLSPAQDAELNLSALPRGLYVVRLQDAQGQTAVRRVQRN